MSFPKIKVLLLTLITILSGLSSLGKEIPSPMSPPRLVNDFAGLLSESRNQSLENKLLGYSDTTSTEIAIVIINSLEGDEINRFTAELGQKWGVGRRGKDNGCVILLSVEDRKVSIQNGYGLEAYLTDAQSKLIIENEMIPAFKEGNYYLGLDLGTTAIIQTLAGTYEGSGNRRGNEKFNRRSIIFLIIIFFVVLSIIRNRRGGPGNRGGGGGWIFFPMGGGGHTYGGGGFGGGGGGGFGGFGGGGFGGGGASGGW